MKHTLTTAARATGVSRSTIHRAVVSGKVSAVKNEEGEYRIDPAELHRVYPAVPQNPKSSDMKQSETHNDTSDDMASKLLELVTEQRDELAELRNREAETIDELDQTKELLQEHRDAARLLIDPETFKEKERKWKEAISNRQAEIEKARAEADALRQQQAESDKALQREQKRVKALESRGLIDRLFNRPIDV